MRLFLSELRKIWHPAVVAAVLALGIMYYLLMPSFYVVHFPNGPNQQASFDLATDWAARFGPTMEPEERAQLDAQLAEEQAEFATWIAAVPEAAEKGIVDYATYAAFCDEVDEARGQSASREGVRGMTYDEARSFQERLFYETNLFTIQEFEDFLQCYDVRADIADEVRGEGASALDKYGLAEGLDEAGHARVAELITGERGYLPFLVREATAGYASNLALWEVLGVVALLAPTFVRDRVCRTRQLQWASRRGRASEGVQLAAGVASAVLLTAVNLVVYGALFLSRGLLAFADFPLFGWVEGGGTWFDVTYGCYLVVLAALVSVLGVGAALWMLLLSRVSSGYVSALLKAVPLFVLLGVIVGVWCLDGTFYIRVVSYAVASIAPPGIEVVLVAGVCVLGAAACAAMLLHDRRCDLAT